MKLHFRDIHFVKSATKESEYPVLRNESGALLPEIAIAGRSNVGKSTLLNHLFKRQGMVKTSSTPGKTQLLNFFTVDDTVGFVDLPGYGFANVPQSVRVQWGPMIQNYLESRETLKLILFLFDIRRLPNEDDLLFIEWVLHAQKAMILVFTKIDKVTRSEKERNMQKILKAIDLQNLHTLSYSALKNIGRRELIALISEAMKDEEAT